MNEVNPELDFTDRRSSREQVAALFGSAPDVILKAAGRFMEQEPGTLDHHNLRIIAAAAPHIGDPNMVAELINDLPITRMRVAAQPMNIATARNDFARVLPTYSPKARQRLVGDLVHQTLIQFLSIAPPDRLSDNARAVIESHLIDLASRPAGKQVEALSSPFTTAAVVDKTLDRIERRIARAEAGTEHRPAGKLPLDVVVNVLANVVKFDLKCVTTEHVERAWNLVERCAQDDRSMRVFLNEAARSSRLSERVAHAMLDAMDRLHPPTASWRDEQTAWRQIWHGYMVSVPEMPESAAWRAARNLYTPDDETAYVDPRWAAVRRYSYGHENERRPFDGGRLSIELLDSLSSEQLDRLVATLPETYLTERVIDAMSDPDALREVSTKAGYLSERAFEALIDNEHLPLDADVGDLALHRPTSRRRSRRTFGNDFLSDRERIFMSDRRLDDRDLAEIVSRETDLRRREPLASLAALHPNAGDALLDYVLTQPNPDRIVVAMASATSSPSLHRRLLDVADTFDRTRDGVSVTGRGSDIRRALLFNGTVDKSVAANARAHIEYERRRRYVDPSLPQTGEVRLVSPVRDRIRSSSGYGPIDIARLVVSGEAPDGRIDALVAATCAGSKGVATTELHEAVSLLADKGLLQASHWEALTSHHDPHTAMSYAMHPSCPVGTRGVQPLASSMLHSTIEALDRGEVLPDEVRLRSWGQLPDESDVPFPVPQATELLDGQVVGDARLRVVRNARELTNAAAYMGNCLSWYEPLVRSGEFIVATADDPSGMVAVAWKVGRRSEGEPLISVSEINSRFNRGNVDKAVRQDVEILTACICNGTAAPVERLSDVAVIADGRESTSHDLTRRPPPRTHALTLGNEPDRTLPQQSSELLAQPVDKETTRRTWIDTDNKAATRDMPADEMTSAAEPVRGLEL